MDGPFGWLFAMIFLPLVFGNWLALGLSATYLAFPKETFALRFLFALLVALLMFYSVDASLMLGFVFHVLLTFAAAYAGWQVFLQPTGTVWSIMRSGIGCWMILVLFADLFALFWRMMLLISAV